MKTRRVILEISPSRLELAAVRGRHVQAWSVARFERSSWPNDFDAALGEYAAPLAEFVTQHGLIGCEALVICRTASGAVQTSTAGRSIATASGEAAARLAVSTSIESGCEPEDAEALCICQDSVAAGQRHFLAYGDSDESIRAIESLLRRCELRPSGVIPLDAVASIEAVRLLQESTVGATAALWIGDHSSVLAVGIDGNTRFVRPIGVGIETLVDALTRPLRRSGESNASICLPRPEARRLLTQIGFPAPNEEIPGLDGFNGEAVLPLLQPLVQRIGLEVKQSLRYATASESRATVAIRVRGPGATIRGLADAIARSTGMTAEAASSAASTDSSVCGGIEALVRSDALPPLFTRVARVERSARRVRQAVLAGVAAALCFIGYEWVETSTQIKQLRTQGEAARLVQAQRQQLADALARALADNRTLQDVRERVVRSVGHGTDPAGLLVGLGAVMPGDIQLSGVEMQSEAQSSRATVRGKLALRPGLDAGGAIRKFVASLGDLPIVSQARLGRTARVTEDGKLHQSFEVNLELTPIPASARVTLGQIETEGSAP